MFLPMLDWTQCAAVERVPGKVSGAWVFKTSQVPVRALFENLEDGATVNEFLTWFPGVIAEPGPKSGGLGSAGNAGLRAVTGARLRREAPTHSRAAIPRPRRL